jgi:hypothetical protein
MVAEKQEWLSKLLCRKTRSEQGCQIFLDTIYQNGGKYTKLPLNYQMAIKIPNICKIFQMGIENTNLFNSKAL